MIIQDHTLRNKLTLEFIKPEKSVDGVTLVEERNWTEDSKNNYYCVTYVYSFSNEIPQTKIKRLGIDLTIGKIPKTSFIRCSKITTIEKNMAIKKVAQISNKKWKEIQEKTKNLLF